MRRTPIPVRWLATLVVAGLATVPLVGSAFAVDSEETAAEQVQSPETVVFDLYYRGLTGQEDPLSYRSFWGFGSSNEADSPFVRAVKKQVREYDLVFNPILKDTQWAVVELKDKKPVALYFDLDGDGKLSDNERIPPTSTTRPQSGGYEYSFVTPDFMIRQDDGREVPFRVMLAADSFGGDRMNYMWSPSCILEGQTTFAGEPMRLFLYGDGFSGAFNVFGNCSFSLIPASQKVEGYIPRDSLSTLICHDGVYYKLSLDGSHEKDKTLQIKIQKDTSPTGQMALDLKAKESLKTRLMYARISGAADDTIQFNTSNAQAVIPVGKYKLASANLCYGVESDDQWQVGFNAGPEFTIVKDETASIEMGELALSVKAVSEQDRWNSEVKPKTTFAKGTSLYLSLEIRGKAGEAYTRFSQKGDSENQWIAVKPHVAILADDGKEVASTDMEYG